MSSARGRRFAVGSVATHVATCAVVAAACACFGIGCSVDTELGVAADIDSAAITVTGTGADATVSTSIVVTFRVGEHALGSRTFQVPTTDVNVGEMVVTTVNLDRPVGFDGTLAPGESEMVTLLGSTVGSGVGADADVALCPTGTSATVRIRWQHRDAADGTALFDTDTAEITTTDITCM